MHLYRLALAAILVAFDARAAPRETDVAFEARNLQRSTSFDRPYIEGPKLQLTGRLAMPEGSGPFPAVVHLHGCEVSIPPRDEAWVARFTSWGFAVLRLDSLGPRGKTSVCNSRGRQEGGGRSTSHRVANVHTKLPLRLWFCASLPIWPA